MMDLVFIQYLFFLGLSFGLNFRHRIPLLFIIISSFLWGTIIITGGILILNVFHFKLIDSQIFLFLLTLIILPLLRLIIIPKLALNLKDTSLILVLSISFFLINLFFHTFNYSLATIDSFALVMLGRTIAYDSFSPTVLYSFTSWGIMIPLLQSMSIFLRVDYLITLEVGFAITLISMFAYVCYKLCISIIKNEFVIWLITILSCLILISTPMFLIQSVYIHTNLPAACFFLQSVACCWFAIEKKVNSWLVLMILAFLGLSFSRTETFIYSIPVLLLLFVSKQIPYKAYLSAVLIYIVSISTWLIYLYMNLQSGTDILDKNRIIVLILALFLLCLFFLVMLNKRIANFSLPLVERFFLLPFFAVNIIMVFLNPPNMVKSDLALIENMFIAGRWGVIFWIWVLTFLLLLKRKQIAIHQFLIKIVLSTVLIISGLGFFRVPYRLTWTDSANRLLTLVFPIILLLLATVLSTYINSRNSYGQISANVE
jgi:hypothetical protein